MCKEWGESGGGLIDSSINSLSYHDSYRMGLNKVSHLSCLRSFEGEINTPEELDLLKPHVLSLRKLCLYEPEESAATFYDVSRFPNLTTLRLAQSHWVEEKVLLALSQLIDLDLENILCPDTRVVQLPTQLRRLALRNISQVNDDGLLRLSKLSSLKLVNACNITTRSIVRLTQLQRLSLDYDESSGLLALYKLPGFVQFTSLYSLKLKNDAYSLFGHLNQLTSLLSLNIQSQSSILDPERLCKSEWS